MNSGSRPLRVVLVWHGEPLEERVFTSPQTITVGSSKKDTFVVPSLGRLGEQFPLFRPSPDNTGYVLTLADGMSGKLNVDQEQQAVVDFLRQGRGVAAGSFREQPL